MLLTVAALVLEGDRVRRRGHGRGERNEDGGGLHLGGERCVVRCGSL